MELATVSQLVENLASAFEEGLDFYVKWKKKLESRNHYRRNERVKAASTSTTNKCAVSTSLDVSGYRIRSSYQIASAIIGPEFSSGDEECRQCLAKNLAQLEVCVASLREAFGSSTPRFINLNEVFLASESIRISCVGALADQYRRLASGRPVPQEIPIPGPRPLSRQEAPRSPTPKLPRSRQQEPGSTSLKVPSTRQRSSRNLTLNIPLPPVPPDEPKEFDSQTAVWSTNSDLPVFKSEPPSPPLTPKDAGSCFGAPSELGASSDISGPSARISLRPKNSVFSIFCPEAMALQVDPSRPMGIKSKCKCGYRWKVSEFVAGKDYMGLKDGFRMTKRFLAKSHCDQGALDSAQIGPDQPKPGYGCVLCTSTGRSETYETAESLRAHINATHDKWQMLHDRDVK
ncbi:hypothetical protein V8F06_002728 [Rhypophila decipiens]